MILGLEVFGTEAVADAIIAREVRSDLGRLNDVVGGESVFERRHGEFDDFVALGFEFFEFGFEGGLNLWVEGRRVHELFDVADGFLLELDVGGTVKVGEGGLVFSVLASGNGHEKVEVGGGFGEEADDV